MRSPSSQVEQAFRVADKFSHKELFKDVDLDSALPKPVLLVIYVIVKSTFGRL